MISSTARLADRVSGRVRRLDDAKKRTPRNTLILMRKNVKDRRNYESKTRNLVGVDPLTSTFVTFVCFCLATADVLVTFLYGCINSLVSVSSFVKVKDTRSFCVWRDHFFRITTWRDHFDGTHVAGALDKTCHIKPTCTWRDHSI